MRLRAGCPIFLLELSERWEIRITEKIKIPTLNRKEHDLGWGAQQGDLQWHVELVILRETMFQDNAAGSY